MTTEDDVQRAYDQNPGRAAWSKFADFKTMITQIINLYEVTVHGPSVTAVQAASHQG